MACILCNNEKLSNEFPSNNASEACNHPCLICLRCLVNGVEKTEKCPQPGCGENISRTSDTVKLFKEILADMFTEYETEYTPLVDVSGGQSFVNVTGLTGTCARIAFSPNSTVHDLKLQIQDKMGVNVTKQKLLYKNRELNVFKEDKSVSTLSYYGVTANSTIHLVVCLYTVPETFDHVVFDLYWGFPASGLDFLDASCLIFKGQNFIKVVDFRGRSHEAVKHSGDRMDSLNKRGHHTIDVYLAKIPNDVTHLFFTLSAWISPNISKYPNPSLRFYEASNPTKDLCNTTFTHANCSQAVVMCSMSKTNSLWQIFDSGQLSNGNALGYEPLILTIQKLIASGY